jgi:septal ring factor EnvC (AmiA/AmiB activator)
MSDEECPINKDNKPRDPIFLIQKIKTGEIEPEKDITTEERQECVEVLKLEGQTNATIAGFLKRDLKTVQRDLKAIWKKHSEDPTQENALYLVAEFLTKARSNHENLVRLAKEGDHEGKVNAARYVGEALREIVKMLQSLGYMPKEATKIQAEINNPQEPEKTTEQLKKELSDFEKNASELGINNPALQEKLVALRKRIELTEVDKELNDLKAQYPSQPIPPEE